MKKKIIIEMAADLYADFPKQDEVDGAVVAVLDKGMMLMAFQGSFTDHGVTAILKGIAKQLRPGYELQLLKDGKPVDLNMTQLDQ